MRKNKSDQSGNVLFYILIAVSLLAALSYAVSQGNRGSLSTVNEEKAKLLASEIIEYGNVMGSAVSQLRLRGIKDSELCFDDPAWGVSDYNHAECTDDLNKIFHISGGGLTWAEPPADAMDSSATPDNLWHIYGDNEINLVGTTCGAASCADLILVVDELSEAVCIQINDSLGVDNPSNVPPTDLDMGETRYTGTFSYSETIGDEAGGTVLESQSAGCFQKTTAPAEYVYYKVLIAR